MEARVGLFEQLKGPRQDFVLKTPLYVSAKALFVQEERIFFLSLQREQERKKAKRGRRGTKGGRRRKIGGFLHPCIARLDFHCFFLRL